MQPVIFTGIANDHRLAREEIFGPGHLRHQIQGLRGRDRARRTTPNTGSPPRSGRAICRTALDATQRLEAGLVQVNQNMVVQANMSYGGIKQSGLGKEASLEAMLEHFT